MAAICLSIWANSWQPLAEVCPNSPKCRPNFGPFWPVLVDLGQIGQHWPSMTPNRPDSANFEHLCPWPNIHRNRPELAAPVLVDTTLLIGIWTSMCAWRQLYEAATWDLETLSIVRPISECSAKMRLSTELDACSRLEQLQLPRKLLPERIRLSSCCSSIRGCRSCFRSCWSCSSSC